MGIFKESIVMSWKNIIQNKMRSFLTILGVMIGVTSIIALISIVQGVTTNITSEVVSMGGNKITVQIQGTPLKLGLTVQDITEIEKIENLSGISPSIQGISSIVYNGNIMEEVIIQGKNNVHFENTDTLLEEGRNINILDVQQKTRVCLVGEDIIKELFWGIQPIGQEIQINGITYTIVGTLQSSDGFSGNSNNNTVIIPYSTAMSLLSTGYISSLDMYIQNADLSDNTTSEVEARLSSAFNGDEDGYSVINMQTILDTVETMTGTMSMMLSGIAAIALIVGGIGIMNMMLVTVTERTREIGLRKAIGATPGIIQIQFVLESLFLSLIGGVLGLFGGIFISFIGCIIIGVEFQLVNYSIPLAIGFSAIIGLVFGFVPAKKASELNPIDALRGV